MLKIQKNLISMHINNSSQKKMLLMGSMTAAVFVSMSRKVHEEFQNYCITKELPSLIFMNISVLDGRKTLGWGGGNKSGGMMP